MQPLRQSFNGFEINPQRIKSAKSTQKIQPLKKASSLQEKIKEITYAFQINVDFTLVPKICHAAQRIDDKIDSDLYHDEKQFFLFKTADKIYVHLKEGKYLLSRGSAKDVFSGFEYHSLTPIAYSLADPSNPNESKILRLFESKKMEWRNYSPTTNGVIQLLEQATLQSESGELTTKNFIEVLINRPGLLSQLIRNPHAHLSYYDLAQKPTYRQQLVQGPVFLSQRDYAELNINKEFIYNLIDRIEKMQSTAVTRFDDPAFTIIQMASKRYVIFTNQKYDKNSEGRIEVFQGFEYPSFKRIAVLAHQKQLTVKDVVEFLGHSPLNKIHFTPLYAKEFLVYKPSIPVKELLIFPLANRGNLNQFLQQHPNLSYRRKLLIMRGVVRGLTLIHREGIIHRDLKPENIFIHFFRKQNLLISEVGDLGLAERTKTYGTPLYFAPEKVASETPADIWALGTTLYPLFFGSPPPWFEKMTQAKDFLTNRSKSSRKLIDWVELLFLEPKNKDSIKHLIWRSVRPDWSQRPLLKEFEKKVEDEVNKVAAMPKNRSASNDDKTPKVSPHPIREDLGPQQ